MHWDRVAAIRSAVLILLGITALAICAFLVYFPAGFAVIGIGLFVIEWLTQPSVGQRA